MNILFAAPADSWGGFFELLQADLAGHRLQATGRFGIDTLEGIDVLVPAMSEVSRETLASADRLQLIQQCGAGLDRVDLEAAARMNIPVANVPSGISGNAESVAELGIYLMIGLLRDVRAMSASLRHRVIGEPAGRALAGRTVGIVGLGGIGRALVERLRPFGVNLAGIKRTDPERAGHELGLQWTGGPRDLHGLLGMSDIVVLCLPLTPSTHGLMNRAAFDSMKEGALLINLSRGGLVDADALRDALASGRIGGAGLDVFWEEPPDPEDRIFGFNVLATPHIGGSTDRSLEGIRRIVVENIRMLEKGLKPLHVMNAASMDASATQGGRTH